MSRDESAEAHALARLRADYQGLLARLEANNAAFQQLARSVFRVQEDERRRLARELHDGIGQNLTALKHQLGLLGEQLEPARHDLREKLENSVQLCAQTLADTRALSRLLRPQILDDLGLDAALQWLARTLGEGGRPTIEVEIEALPPLPGEVQTLLFRIAQEALGNVRRHANAERAVLRLDCRAGWLRLTVWDDGRGFDTERAMRAASSGQSAGLAGMRERLALFGGQLRIDSGDERGTRLLALLPLDTGTGTLPA